MKYVAGTENVADILTKGLPTGRFQKTEVTTWQGACLVIDYAVYYIYNLVYKCCKLGYKLYNLGYNLCNLVYKRHNRYNRVYVIYKQLQFVYNCHNQLLRLCSLCNQLRC